MTTPAGARSVGGALLTQATLHAELLGEAWLVEKDRLRGLAVASLLLATCLICTSLAVGALVVSISWDTAQRVPIVAGLLIAYGLATVAAWRSLSRQVLIRNEVLAASRDELAADLRLLRDNL